MQLRPTAFASPVDLQSRPCWVWWQLDLPVHVLACVHMSIVCVYLRFVMPETLDSLLGVVSFDLSLSESLQAVLVVRNPSLVRQLLWISAFCQQFPIERCAWSCLKGKEGTREPCVQVLVLLSRVWFCLSCWLTMAQFNSALVVWSALCNKMIKTLTVLQVWMFSNQLAVGIWLACFFFFFALSLCTCADPAGSGVSTAMCC